jgi:hypothetical protein
MMEKYSGSTTSFAPCSTAISISRSASLKLAATFGPEAICIPATLTMPALIDGVALGFLVLSIDLIAMMTHPVFLFFIGINAINTIPSDVFINSTIDLGVLLNLFIL